MRAETASARPPRSAQTAEHVAQHVLEPAAARSAAGSAAALKSIRTPAEGFELPATAGAGLRAGSLEAAEARLALGVDLAAVESLALVGVAENFVSRVKLGEARGGLGIVLVGVRVQLFGQPPEGALDLSRAPSAGVATLASMWGQ
jgi:hypothetical protein